MRHMLPQGQSIQIASTDFMPEVSCNKGSVLGCRNGRYRGTDNSKRRSQWRARQNQEALEVFLFVATLDFVDKIGSVDVLSLR